MDGEALKIKYTDRELLYAETARCQCGAGMAYPLDHEAARSISAWVCSASLKGETASGSEHDKLPFMFWKVREENSINGRAGQTTRPPGTVSKTVGYATCPKCGWKWKSEPYVTGHGSPEPNHHWFSGPCPECGYAVGGGGSYSTSDGAPIETRYKHVVVDA